MRLLYMVLLIKKLKIMDFRYMQLSLLLFEKIIDFVHAIIYTNFQKKKLGGFFLLAVNF